MILERKYENRCSTAPPCGGFRNDFIFEPTGVSEIRPMYKISSKSVDPFGHQLVRSHTYIHTYIHTYVHTYRFRHFLEMIGKVIKSIKTCISVKFEKFFFRTNVYRFTCKVNPKIF